jgi:hypothetical protein
MARIDPTQFSPDYFEAAKARWEVLSEDHKTLAEAGNFDYGIEHLRPRN